jgi:hypothetical protein
VFAGLGKKQRIIKHNPQPLTQNQARKAIKVLPDDPQVRPEINHPALISTSQATANLETQIIGVQLPGDGAEKTVGQLLAEHYWPDEGEEV